MTICNHSRGNKAQCGMQQLGLPCGGLMSPAQHSAKMSKRLKMHQSVGVLDQKRLTVTSSHRAPWKDYAYGKAKSAQYNRARVGTAK